MAKYVLMTDGPVFDYKPDYQNETGDRMCFVQEDWQDLMLMVGPLVENGREFRIDCFNGTLDAIESPSIDEYIEFIENMDEYSLNEYLF